MSKGEKEKIKKIRDLLSYVLTCQDVDITLATVEAVIEILDELA